jgi:hypothetical protein
MKHKHADLIHAWADGAQIQQYKINLDEWHDVSSYPVFDERLCYRIKPEPKPDVVVYSRVVGKFLLIGCEGIEIQQLILRLEDSPNIKYTFGGEWGNLKAVEML